MSGPGDPRDIACTHGRGLNCRICYGSHYRAGLHRVGITRQPRYDFAAMRQTLKAGGVQVVAAPQLFPTPPDIAARAVELLELDNWNGEHWERLTILEPSAGTGNLLAALLEKWPAVDVVAWGINQELSDGLLVRFPPPAIRVMHGDFLLSAVPLEHELYSAVIMNPPFERGVWAKHIRHAWECLRPGGRLVAILPDTTGVRDRLELLGSVFAFEQLPAGTFADTGVRTVLVVMDK